MPRGAAGKLRRRNNRSGSGKKGDNSDDVDAIFGDDVVDAGRNNNNIKHDFGPPKDDADDDNDGIPLPPGMSKGQKGGGGGTDQVEQDNNEPVDDGPADPSAILLPKKKKAKTKAAKKRASSKDSDDDDDDSPEMPMPSRSNKLSAATGIKSGPLMLLILMTGTTILPALIFAGDYLGNFVQKHHVLGQLGFRLGLGAVPRKRVVSFYEKHDPNKLDQVPKILSKYYGDYPKLIKSLERKYHDYGYFIGWEQDEAPLTLALDKLKDAYDVWLSQYWNRHAPQILKTAARNVRYNLTYLHKQAHKAWKKRVWPILEPFLGVPKGAAAQKRKDAKQAREAERKKKKATTTGRRRNAEFRDEEEDQD